MIFLCALFPIVGYAQGERLVRGVVTDSDGTPMAGVMVKAVNSSDTIISGSDGRFEFKIPVYIKFVEAVCEGYLSARAEVDGSYLIMKMKVDQKYLEEKKRKEEAARLMKIRIAEEKAQAEEAARRAAEKEAAEKAKAQERAEKKAQNKKIFGEPVKGYMSVVNLSYTLKTGFDYLGADYIGGYRFNNKFFLGMGVGYRMACSPSDFVIDKINTGASLPGNTYEIPLFAHFRYNFLNGRCSPFVGLSIGTNISAPATIQLKLYDVKYSTIGAFANPQVGLNYRMTPKSSIYLAVGFNAYTMSKCIDNTGYSATLKHSLYYSADFHIGVTF